MDTESVYRIRFWINIQCIVTSHTVCEYWVGLDAISRTDSKCKYATISGIVKRAVYKCKTGVLVREIVSLSPLFHFCSLRWCSSNSEISKLSRNYIHFQIIQHFRRKGLIFTYTILPNSYLHKESNLHFHEPQFPANLHFKFPLKIWSRISAFLTIRGPEMILLLRFQP